MPDIRPNLIFVIFVLFQLFKAEMTDSSNPKISETSNSRPAIELTQWPDNFIEVPLVRQARDYTCGVSATMTVVCYWTAEDLSEGPLSKTLNASKEEGTGYHEIVNYAIRQGFQVEVRENMELKDLHLYIDKKVPVIVLIQAWPLQEMPVYNWTNDWADGHYVVAVGYDNERMYFMDPSTLGLFTYIPNEEFLERWHDVDGCCHKLVHWGLIMTKPNHLPKWKPRKVNYLA